MIEIPLETLDQTADNEDDTPTINLRLYKRELNDAVTSIGKIDQWRIVKGYEEKRIKFYTYCPPEDHCTRWYKSQGTLQCDAAKLIHVHTECDGLFRQSWDIPELSHLTERETYFLSDDDCFKFIDFTIIDNRPKAILLNQRPIYFMGLLYNCVYSTSHEYRSVFQSCYTHHHLRVPKGCVQGHATVQLYTKTLNDESCVAQLIIKLTLPVMPFAPILSHFESHMADMLHRYERIASLHWEHYYSKDAQEQRERLRREK